LNQVEVLIGQSDSETLNTFIDSIRKTNKTFYNDHYDFFLRARGSIETMQKNETEAFKLYSDGLKMAEFRNNNPEIALAKMELGLAFIHFSEPQLAIKLFNEAEVIFNELDQKVLVSRCAYLRAVSHKRMGEFEISNEILADVQADYKLLNDSVGIAETSNAIGLNYKNLKQPEKAIPYFQEAIVLFDKYDKTSALAKGYNNLANIYQMLGEWDLAIENHNSSLEIKQELGDNLGVAISYINISVIHKRTSRLNQSLTYGERSLNLLEGIGPRGNSARIGVYSLMSELHEKMGNTNEALKFARMEGELIQQLRKNEEATLIDLFEKKQDAKFYTISDSLMESKRKLQTKFNAAQTENASLTRQKTMVIIVALIIGVILLAIVAFISYSRFRATRIIKNQLEVTNKELYETRIGKEEKEVLLQEIHHRVKNNMQIISSLIRLQSNQIDDTYTQSLFQETQHRINSMALVHEQLYRTNDFEKLKLSEYLSALIEHLISSYRDNKTIHTLIDIKFGTASIDNIIPIGLIVNEIVSNSLKHAFNDQQEGIISATFSKDEENDRYLLQIGDNGIGNKGVKVQPSNDEPSDSLGMELIQSLTEQLDGTLKLDTSQGYQYSIYLPKI